MEFHSIFDGSPSNLEVHNQNCLSKIDFWAIFLNLHILRRQQNFAKSQPDLSYVVSVKSTVEISQNFVSISEYMNFNLNVIKKVVLKPRTS